MSEVKKILAKDEPTTENLAASMREAERKAIAKWVVESYNTDKRARKPWEDKRNRWYKLWLMEREPEFVPAVSLVFPRLPRSLVGVVGLNNPLSNSLPLGLAHGRGKVLGCGFVFR